LYDKQTPGPFQHNFDTGFFNPSSITICRFYGSLLQLNINGMHLKKQLPRRV